MNLGVSQPIHVRRQQSIIYAPAGQLVSHLTNRRRYKFIEEGVNDLIRKLLPEGEQRKDALAMGLADKIEKYIGIANYAEASPDIESEQELREGLRKLLNLVNEYFHRLY